MSCPFPRGHDWPWPIRGIQTCTRCGRTRPAELELPTNPRFDIPRYDPKAREVEPAKVAVIGQRRRKRLVSGE